jgi:hypothetical protein
LGITAGREPGDTPLKPPKQKTTTKNVVAGFSDPAGIRTQDPILKRDVLYLLSYRIGLKILELQK